MPTPIVIDLSHHNTIPTSLKATAEQGIIGVIHKASQGMTMKDDKVDARFHLAKEAGLLFGLYHFISPGKIGPQVENFMEVYNRLAKEDPNILVALDYEDPKVTLDDCHSWSQMVSSRTGKKVVLYSGHVLREKVETVAHPFVNGTNYPLWLAQYGPKAVIPRGWKDLFLWQYTDKGGVAGVTPPTDLNAGDAAAVRAFWAGPANQPAPEPTPEPTPTPEPVPPLPVGTKDFGDAYRILMAGGKVWRKDWGTKFLWAVLMRPTGSLTRMYFARVSAIGEVVPWTPDQLDLFSTDWQEVTI